MTDLCRRRLLELSSTAVVAGLTAGCTESGSDATGGGVTDAQDGGGDTDGADGDTDTMTGDLDLREANVVGVELEQNGSTYSFDVTLHHDDDGEDGYANWWQVERLDGTQVGRRVLTHPHSQQPFTRSDSYEIPSDVTCVVLRGHDQTHEYGGQAALVNLESGATRLVDQGSERQSFAESDCP
jgi:hypothetical protein